MNFTSDSDPAKINYTLGWFIYITIVTIIIVSGIGLDMWYVKKQKTIFERKPEEYLIHE